MENASCIPVLSIELLRNFNFARASAENAFCRPLACKRSNDTENTLAGKMSITLCMFTDANAVGTLSVDLSAGSFALMKP